MPTALIVGASRGLGYAIVKDLLRRDCQVVATERHPNAPSPLHELADTYGCRLVIELLDTTQPEQLPPLRSHLSETFAAGLDLLFVNAGTTNNEHTPIGDVPTTDFVDIMITNALSPMRVIEALQNLVKPDGLIGVMTSGQGSITNNTTGSREVYRGSKAALNQFMRSFAVRLGHKDRALLLMAPGWVKTALGGDKAPFIIEENVPKIVDVMLAKRGTPGLEHLDFRGDTVPW